MDAIVGCYLWDLIDEGAERVCDRLVGEIGASGLCVRATSDRIDQLRPHGSSPGIRRQEAAAHFRPNRARYANTRVRPLPADWIGRGNPLADMNETATRAGLRLDGWVTLCQGEALASKYGPAATRNAFGDVTGNGICPSNPDVREYGAGLLSDLAEGYGLDTLVLDGAWFPASRGWCSRKVGMECGQLEQMLWDLCLCESCRQLAIDAGLSPDAIARTVSVALESWMTTGRPADLGVAEYLANHQLLADFLATRSDLITRWIERMASIWPGRLVYHLPADALASGTDIAMVAAHVDACMVSVTDDCERAIELIGEIETTIGKAGNVWVRLEAYPPCCPDSPALVRTLTGLAERRVGSVLLENYGVIPVERMAWLKQAIRAARRVAL